MQWLLLAGAAGALGTVAALWAPALALRVPVRRFPKGRLGYYAVLVGAFVFLVSVLMGWVCAAIDGVPAWIAPVVGLAAGALMIRVSIDKLMPLRRVQRIAERIAREGSSAEARDALVTVLRRSRPRGAKERRVHAVLVLSVVGALADARLWDDALVLLEELGEKDLTPQLLATKAASLATCRLYAGDREGAREALADVDRPAPYPLTEQALIATTALLAALEGDPARALAEVDRAGKVDEPRMERALGIARAQALAARGDEPGAREVLLDLRRSHGEGALLRVQALGGPASPLATALLKDGESPYRG